MLGLNENYGAYRTAGNLSVSVRGLERYTNYRRELDLETGVQTTSFHANGTSFETNLFCTYPDQVCVYSISTSNGTIPEVSIQFENTLDDPELFNLTCGGDFARVTGLTQLGPPLGMKYDAVVKVGTFSPGLEAQCTDGILTLAVPDVQKTLYLVLGAATNFDQARGNVRSGYSFQGEDPEDYVEQITTAAARKPLSDLLNDHLVDYWDLQRAFSFDLPDPHNSQSRETSDLLSSYSVDSDGDPFVEALLFDYARHLLIASSRENSLPANLQGRWTEELFPAWSADYHTNINLQENYWFADQTGLGRTQDALWTYMEQNWVPRGTETAKLLYNASGWVVHNEVNIFGHTAMKESASWALCKF